MPPLTPHGDHFCETYYHPEETNKIRMPWLQNYPRDYEVCRDDSDPTCYIFLKEQPFFEFGDPEKLTYVEKKTL